MGHSINFVTFNLYSEWPIVVDVVASLCREPISMAILAINRLDFLYSDLDMGMVLRSYFSSLLNYGTNYNAGLKQDFDVMVRS